MKDVKYDGWNGIGMIFYKRSLSFCQQKINQILGSVRCLHQCEIYLCLCILSDICKPSHHTAHTRANYRVEVRHRQSAPSCPHGVSLSPAPPLRRSPADLTPK